MNTFIPFLNKEVRFHHRDGMASVHPLRRFCGPLNKSFVIPPTLLPVDSTGDATVYCPIDGNNTYGDCGEAMAAHTDNILTFRQGKGTQSYFNTQDLVNQYLSVSPNDGGLSEEDVVNKIWKVGIAGNAQAIITDALDINLTNIAMAQFAIDNFYTIQVGWSVPDLFINGFQTGTTWANAAIPNPNQGHFTPIADVNINGYYRLWTWGSWCWVSPKFMASVQPQSFIVFSPRQFDKVTGLDSKGRHITLQADLWQQCGGNPIPLAIINQFPPLSGPLPPVPVPPVNNIQDVIIHVASKSITVPAGWKKVTHAGHCIVIYPHSKIIEEGAGWV